MRSRLPLVGKAMPRRLLLALVALTSAASSAGGVALIAEQHVRTKLSAQQRAQCEARRGEIRIAGLSGNEMCALPYADGGRSCTDGSQCEGDCLYSGPRSSASSGRPVTGQCESHAYGFGCRFPVEEGRVKGGICVD